MEFSKLITERYSCKAFSEKKIDKEVLKEILGAGLVAPTAKNSQNFHIYVLESEEALKAVDNATPCRYGAPTVLAISFNTKEAYVYPEGGYTSGEEDASIVATHIILAAKDLGVDSCWLNFVKVDTLKTELGLNEDERIVMLLDLGFAKPEFKPLENHYNSKSFEELVSLK